MRVSRQETKRPILVRLASGFSLTVQKYPALAGGATALAVMMSLITANAVWYQPDRHPAPIFATRAADDNSVGSIRRVSANPVRTVSTKRFEIAHAKPVYSELTKELQIALADKKIYAGEIDGLYGSRTKSAIIEYQNEKKMTASGKPSAKLLSHILLSGTTIPRVPVPVHHVALPGTDNRSNLTVQSKELVSAIQAGLKNYGYDEVVIDGLMGNQTTEAIKRFELDYGLQITGEASKNLLKKLNDIGATGQG